MVRLAPLFVTKGPAIVVILPDRINLSKSLSAAFEDIFKRAAMSVLVPALSMS
jgi:hypothetical protein